MRPRPKKLAFRPSPTRFVLWGIGAIIIGVLAFMTDSGKLGERMEEAKKAAEQRDRQPTGQKNTPPAFRMGVMARVSHAPALLALEKGYLLATAQGARNDPDAWAEVRLFHDSRELERRLESGELDAATVPMRSAVALAARLGDRAPRIVSGCCLGGDDRLVTRSKTPASLTGLRLGVTEAPTLDLEAAVAGAIVTLSPAASMQKRLISGEVDAAIASEPTASSIAATSGAHVLDLGDIGAAPIEAGTVLVVSRALLDRDRDLIEALVGWFELAAFEAQQDPDYAGERIRDAIENFRFQPAPLVVWQKAMTSVTINTDIPGDALERIAAASVPPVTVLNALLISEFLVEARKVKAEANR